MYYVFIIQEYIIYIYSLIVYLMHENVYIHINILATNLYIIYNTQIYVYKTIISRYEVNNNFLSLLSDQLHYRINPKDIARSFLLTIKKLHQRLCIPLFQIYVKSDCLKEKTSGKYRHILCTTFTRCVMPRSSSSSSSKSSSMRTRSSASVLFK